MTATRLHCIPAPWRSEDAVRSIVLHGVHPKVARWTYRQMRYAHPPHTARALTLATFAGVADRIEVSP